MNTYKREKSHEKKIDKIPKPAVLYRNGLCQNRSLMTTGSIKASFEHTASERLAILVKVYLLTCLRVVAYD